VELSQDRSDVFSTGRAANQTSSGVLDGLKALQNLLLTMLVRCVDDIKIQQETGLCEILVLSGGQYTVTPNGKKIPPIVVFKYLHHT